MTKGFAARYRAVLKEIAGRVLPGHGYPVARLTAAEVRLGVRLPRALRDYYTSIGRHRMNQVYNRLLTPEDLHTTEGRLVFMEENQQVVYWAVRASNRAGPDPGVVQAMDPEEGPWQAEGTTCSTFLLAMLCWQAVCGGLRYGGYAERVVPRLARRIAATWPKVGRDLELSAYARAGQVICVLKEARTVLIQVGARTRRDFRAIEGTVGITFNQT